MPYSAVLFGRAQNRHDVLPSTSLDIRPHHGRLETPRAAATVFPPNASLSAEWRTSAFSLTAQFSPLVVVVRRADFERHVRPESIQRSIVREKERVADRSNIGRVDLAVGLRWFAKEPLSGKVREETMC